MTSQSRPFEIKSNCASQVLAMGLMRQGAIKRAQRTIKLDEDGNIPSLHLLPLNGTSGCSLNYKDGEFTVDDEGKKFHVERHELDDALRMVCPKTLPAYLKRCKIGVSRGSDGNFMLRTHVNASAGGPGLAWLGDWAFDFAWAYGTHLVAARALNKIPDVAEGVGEAAKKVSELINKMSMEERYAGCEHLTVNILTQQARARDLELLAYYKSHRMFDQAINLQAKIDEGYLHIGQEAMQAVSAKVKENVAAFVKKHMPDVGGKIGEFEKYMGGRILSDKVQDVATGALKNGALGAVCTVGFTVGSALFTNSNLGSATISSGGVVGAAGGIASEQVAGGVLDQVLAPAAIATVAMNGFAVGSGRYILKSIIHYGLTLVPGW